MLPFDTLRPFKSTPAEFTPRDTLPWERIATNLLQGGSPDQVLYCISPPEIVESIIAWLVSQVSLPPQAHILDVGCGSGVYSHRLAQSGYQVTAIDIAQPFLDYAQAKAVQAGLAITYRNLSMFDLDFEAEFDAILLINTISKRLSLAELSALCQRLRRALKPGGQLIAEFNILPPSFDKTKPTVRENLLFVEKSVWDTEFHAWLLRDLTFPETQEQVNHHLILTSSGQVEEYWSRFTMHTPETLEQLFIEAGFTVRGWARRELWPSHKEGGDTFSLIWLEKP